MNKYMLTLAKARETRRTRKIIADLNDHLLRDIGIVRGAIPTTFV